jgi:cytochrome c oxidase subunit IV
MAKPKKTKQTAPETLQPAGAPGVPVSALQAQAAAQQSHDHVGHIVPMYVLVGTFLGLIVLTVVTVAASYVDFGRLNLWIALLIASVKASLVVYFFMHLKWDRPLNSVIFLSSMLFVILFIGFALTDTEEYQPDVEAYTSAQP